MGLKIDMDFNFKLEQMTEKAAKELVLDALEELFTGAFEQFVRETVDASLIRTGMSRASLIPIATKLGFGQELQREIESASKLIQGRKGYGRPWNPNAISDIAHGIRIGQSSFTLDLGGKERDVYQLTFNMNVFQHHWHEGFKANALKAGEDAFIEYIEVNTDKYISPKLINLIID
jgi:hypothetical protein